MHTYTPHTHTQTQEKKAFEISPWLRTDTRGGALVWTVSRPPFFFISLSDTHRHRGRALAWVLSVPPPPLLFGSFYLFFCGLFFSLTLNPMNQVIVVVVPFLI